MLWYLIDLSPYKQCSTTFGIVFVNKCPLFPIKFILVVHSNHHVKFPILKNMGFRRFRKFRLAEFEKLLLAGSRNEYSKFPAKQYHRATSYISSWLLHVLRNNTD